MNILVVVGLLVAVWVLFSIHQRRSASRAARRILEHSKKLYRGRHEYREVVLSDVPGLDAAFYERVSEQLVRAGHVHLGDVEDLTSSAASPEMRTVIRIFVGSGRTNAVAVYHVRVRGWIGILLWFFRKHSVKVVEVESHLDDGVVLGTNNTSLAAGIEQPPEIRVEHLPAEEGIEALLARHESRVAAYLADHPGVVPRRLASLPDVLREQERIEQLKAEFRKDRGGGVSAAEVRRVAGEPLGGEVADRMEELQREGGPDQHST